MLNRGVLPLTARQLPGLKRRPALTKTLEWNLYWCGGGGKGGGTCAALCVVWV